MRARHVLVDMTPLEAGGRNGGAGLVAATLVRELSRLAPTWRFTLLTAASSDAELSSLDRDNVVRQCVVGPRGQPPVARQILERVLPASVRSTVKQLYWTRRTRRRNARLAADLQPDVLLCPLTVPYFWRPDTPTVSIVYDLQHVSFPEFFSDEQRLNRQRHLVDVCARATRVVCISNYVRQTVVANQPHCATRVETIPLCVLDAPLEPDRGAVERLGLRRSGYVLYPANFWPHKNHRRLIEALRLYRQDHPEDDLKIVCTGAPNGLMAQVQAEAEARLAGSVVFGGYVSSAELLGLLDASRGLVFPSLYEGFGMPVLEAMARSKPVLCSNVTSLPEVAGDAAVYFDPTNSRSIATALEAISLAPDRMSDLIARGQQRVRRFGDAQAMAARYLATLEAAMLASAV